MEDRERAQHVASLVAWLDRTGCQRVMRLLLVGSHDEAESFLRALFSDLPEGFDLSHEAWSDALLDGLEARIAPGSEDWERAPTDMVPIYARHALDVRAL
jgi:hypothetical protein